MYERAVVGAALAAADLRVSAARQADCQAACTAETRLRCFQFSFSAADGGCLLAGAAGRLRRAPASSVAAERRCGRSQACAGRHLTYEKVSGHVVRSAEQRLLLTAAGGSGDGITADCRQHCDAVSSRSYGPQGPPLEYKQYCDM